MCLGVKLVTFMARRVKLAYTKVATAAECGGRRAAPPSVCGLSGDAGAEGTGGSEKGLEPRVPAPAPESARAARSAAPAPTTAAHTAQPGVPGRSTQAQASEELSVFP